MVVAWACLSLLSGLTVVLGQCRPPDPDIVSGDPLLRDVDFCDQPCPSECVATGDDCYLLRRCPDEGFDDCVCWQTFNQDYEALSAKEKFEHVWDLIRSTPEPRTEWQSVAGSLVAPSLRVFEYGSDYTAEGTRKVLHGAYGMHASIEISVSNADAHQYGGILADGCKNAILRVSGVAEFPGSLNVASFGFGIKCFVDGSPSANLAIMNNVVPQPDFDFWNRNFSNHYEFIDEIENTPLCPLLHKFEAASSCPAKLGIWEWVVNRQPSDFDLCDGDTWGAGPLEAPYRLVFVPASGLSFPSSAYCPETFVNMMSRIPKKTKIFDVYMQPLPNTPVQGKVFEIWTKTNFYTSSFGDDRLVFRHSEFGIDFFRFGAVGDINAWLDEVDAERECHSSFVLPQPPYAFQPLPLENISCPFVGCPSFPIPPEVNTSCPVAPTVIAGKKTRKFGGKKDIF